MNNAWLSISVSIAFLTIAILFAKGVLIWCDAMLKQSQKWYIDSTKLHDLRTSL